ncbi:MAG TPA: polysaccharide deacetylase family protein, partial [Herpetosiphonaceae bacterium]
VLLETAPAPAGADRLAISLHALADDWLFIDDLHLNQALVIDSLRLSADGAYLEPWPAGAAAAVSFSVDWETAMGGYVHSFSATTPADAERQGLESRQGTANLLALLRAAGKRGTWFGNGYNFLLGNREGRTWMGDPVFGWATTSRPWRTDRWAATPWFADDPRGTAASHPGWYFGDLIAPLAEGGQPIESHTFSHLNVGFASPAELRADLDAWRQVAAERGVAPATALAFPWGGSAGMSEAHWQALADAGIDAVTRTQIDSPQRQYLLVDRARRQPRLLPGRDVLAFPDQPLNPEQRTAALQTLAALGAAGGVLDFWAHTNEITSPEQQAAWRDAINAASADPRLWVASLPEIAARWRGVRQVRIDQRAGSGGSLRLLVANPGPAALPSLALRLPEGVERAESASPLINQNNERLVLDLDPGATVEIVLWLKP